MDLAVVQSCISVVYEKKGAILLPMFTRMPFSLLPSFVAQKYSFQTHTRERLRRYGEYLMKPV